MKIFKICFGILLAVQFYSCSNGTGDNRPEDATNTPIMRATGDEGATEIHKESRDSSRSNKEKSLNGADENRNH